MAHKIKKNTIIRKQELIVWTLHTLNILKNTKYVLCIVLKHNGIIIQIIIDKNPKQLISVHNWRMRQEAVTVYTCTHNNPYDQNK